jgi:short chain dehydrogenase
MTWRVTFNDRWTTFFERLMLPSSMQLSAAAVALCLSVIFMPASAFQSSFLSPFHKNMISLTSQYTAAAASTSSRSQHTAAAAPVLHMSAAVSDEAKAAAMGWMRRQGGFGVVITGGTRGLGYCLAREFIRRGDRVVICGRSPARVQAAVAALQREFNLDSSDSAASDGTSSAVPAAPVTAAVFGTACDVSQPLEVQALAMFAKTKLGGTGGLTDKQSDGVSTSTFYVYHIQLLYSMVVYGYYSKALVITALSCLRTIVAPLTC